MTDGAPETRAVAQSHERTLLRSIRLEVMAGPDRGRTFSPTGERTVIGTHRSADLVLTDETVSRLHCELLLGGAGVRVRDLNSTNGTVIDDLEVADALLRGPAVLALGDSRVAVAPVDDHVVVALSPEDRFGPLRGASPAMRAVFAMLERAASSEATVLLGGETGVGKDLAALAVHGAGARRDGPFIVVDCGAVPGELLESELFGHVRGAFTGASADRIGAFEAACGGTLFLDEVGELALDLQPKLLRALETRTVKPVGSAAPVPVDVRIIAATNRNLAAEVNGKRFRSDLYYRLAVLPVHIPPLRDRREDIPLLIEAILDSSRLADHPKAGQLLAPATLAELARHPFPGNVRELRNYVERFLALGELALPDGSGPATAESSPVDIRQPYRRARRQWLARFERLYLEQLLEANGDNVTAAARAAGVDRVHLHRLLSRVGLR